MKRFLPRSIARVLLLAASARPGPCSWGRPDAPPSPMQSTLTIHADQPVGTISRDIYGQFSEHLGHGIYEGI